MITTVAFDGDDTLWHSENLFADTQQKFHELLGRWAESDDIRERLYDTEARNLGLYGYGVKGFTLSMVETAIEATSGQVGARDIQTILDYGKAMVGSPVELVDWARPTLVALTDRFRLMLITKGDLFDQESKIARSGLAELFWSIEVVRTKDEPTYRRILARHEIDPAEFMMVGDSMRSDVDPVLAIGGSAVHVPASITWEHEHLELPESPDGRFHQIQVLGDLPLVLDPLA